MILLDRIAAKIAAQRGCTLAFPCKHCGTAETFDGSGCRILAFAALSAMTPDPSNNEDDDSRCDAVAETFAYRYGGYEIADVVTAWFEHALEEEDEPESE